MRNTFYKIVLEDAVVREWWIENLDLLLDDEKFRDAQIWTRGNKQKLTGAVNRRMKGTVRLGMPDAGKTPAHSGEYISMTSDGSVCVSLFRHIRNALAHKRVELVIRDHARYYRMRDYYQEKVTADLLISQEILVYFCQRYREIACDSGKKRNSRKNRGSSGNFCLTAASLREQGTAAGRRLTGFAASGPEWH